MNSRIKFVAKFEIESVESSIFDTVRSIDRPKNHFIIVKYLTFDTVHKSEFWFGVFWVATNSIAHRIENDRMDNFILKEVSEQWVQWLNREVCGGFYVCHIVNMIITLMFECLPSLLLCKQKSNCSAISFDSHGECFYVSLTMGVIFA